MQVILCPAAISFMAISFIWKSTSLGYWAEWYYDTPMRETAQKAVPQPARCSPPNTPGLPAHRPARQPEAASLPSWRFSSTGVDAPAAPFGRHMKELAAQHIAAQHVLIESASEC